MGKNNWFDVIVVGLGAAGSAAAFHLASRKQRILGLEQYGPAHDKGSSHGRSRIIRQSYHESPEYVPMVLRAYELWEQLEHTSGQEILRVIGGLIVGSETSEIVQGMRKSSREYGLQVEGLTPDEVKRRFPALHLRSSDVGVFEKRAGYVRPEAAIEAHLRLAAEAGAELHFDEAIAGWTADPPGEGVTVTTVRGTYQAGRLLIAAGAWAPEWARLAIPFSVQRHVMAWFDAGQRARFFLPERLPVYIWDVNGRDCFYGFPITDGAGTGAKIAMHSGGEECSPATIRREITDEDIAELRRQMTEFVPWLNGPLVRAETCMYTLTPDRHFVVSLHPEYPQVAVAAGFSGHGFKFASVIGEILADLAIEGSTRYPISFLSGRRFLAAP